jgi:hypothetical protein
MDGIAHCIYVEEHNVDCEIERCDARAIDGRAGQGFPGALPTGLPNGVWSGGYPGRCTGRSAVRVSAVAAAGRATFSAMMLKASRQHIPRSPIQEKSFTEGFISR